MNVVHLYDGHEKVYDGRGSVPDVVWNLARETADRGHDVRVLERQWDGLDDVAEHDGVRFSRLSLATGSDEPWDDLPYEMVSSVSGSMRLVLDRMNFAASALRPLSALDPDVIHAHLPFAANLLVTIAPHLRRKLVYTAHLGETEKRVVEPTVSPDVTLAKRAARTIALNPSMRAAFRRRGVSDETVSVIPNGVDTTQFDHVGESERAAVREEFGIDADVVVLFVGTITPRKGVTELATAAGQLFPIDRADAELLVVGNTTLDPEYASEVRSTLADTGVEDSVTLTGFISETKLAACYDLADLLVLPSYEEGSSIAVSEALAAELPVVGSRIDGIRQQIEHGTHGLLTEPGDTDTLADYIERLVRDDAERASMTQAVTSRAQDLSWQRVTDRLLDVYRGVAT